jgi:hypothetical protein
MYIFLISLWSIEPIVSHPKLIECVCNSTLATEASVQNSASLSNDKNQRTKLVIPGCINDVFAETGIRWYINGPFDGAVKYEKGKEEDYSEGRAAQRFISLGYRCWSIQLSNPLEPKI